MTKRTIPFSPPDVGKRELEEIALAIRSGWITTGSRVKRFERCLQAYCQTGQIVTGEEKLNTGAATRSASLLNPASLLSCMNCSS